MNIRGNLLIVDDNKDVLSALEILLEDEFEALKTLSNPNQIPHELHSYQPDVILLDMNYNTKVNTGNEGMFWLKRIKESAPEVVVIMFTAFGDINLAVKAMKEGATDFVLKPWDNEKLTATLKSAVKLSLTQKESNKLKVKNEILEEEVSKIRPEIIGESKKFKELISTIEKVAPTDASVLITGENGTGKSIIAREIHLKSNRKDEAFVSVDLGSISESLFESELFGFKKGAFTDAKSDSPGRLLAANGGSLFLDEIGNLPVNLQTKLLSVLQNKTITPLGSNVQKSIDIRLITATNASLSDLIKAGKFREDLLYRINTISIEIPALKDRIDDIKILAQNFLEKFTKKYNKLNLKLNDEFVKVLEAYNWPGNIRELEHCVERCVILSQSDTLDTSDLNIASVDKKVNISGSLEEIEKQAILNAIEKHNGNVIRAARELNITRQTIYNKMKKYGL